ncbi:MAG: sigma-54-dependent Fis family transcriptional regulator [Deltaproteobacteria bacterium]|nr:sigma-54-dependent Fis family transcriptional regulator [Deltaproteobacteria bacterium]
MNKEKIRILVVDDEASHRLMLRAILKEDYEIFESKDGEDAIKKVEESYFDVVLLDLKMEPVDGITALSAIKKIAPMMPVIMMTAYGDIKSAVEALKLGAYDYITKPLDIDSLKHIIKNAIEYYRSKKENILLKERLKEHFSFPKIIANSAAMIKVFDTVQMVAPTDVTVLILGESGTGKELIANAIHQLSQRKDGPFVKVNCAAIPETLLEAEMFGYVRGAFTGASTKREGRFSLANKGTIFLDEIGDMPISTQAKLLRVIQEREFEPLGSSNSIKVDVRIIAATNKDLKKEIKEGKFREDLYYRLSVVEIDVPPLRERKEDIPILAHHFLNEASKRNKINVKQFEPLAMDLLIRYNWPGNIRELENLIERGVVLSKGEFFTHDLLPPNLKEESEKTQNIAPNLLMPLKEVEKQLIINALKKTSGNKTKAAQILGITRKTLFNKIKEHKIKAFE